MAGLPGIASIADVQARIASIRASFGTDGTMSAGASSSAPAPIASTVSADAPDFAALLEGATSSIAPSDGMSLDGTAASVASPNQPAGNVSALRTTFAHDLLSTLGAPETSENIRAITAWAQAEGTKAAFNPLATTRSAPDTTNFNHVGVKNYPTYAEGVQATAATLQNGLYNNILAALAQGNDAQSVAQAVASSRWGTGGRVLQVLQSQAA